MKTILLILLIPIISFSQEINLLSMSTQKNETPQYNEIYNEIDTYIETKTLSSPASSIIITNTVSTSRPKPKSITPVPKHIYNVSNYSNINQFFIDIQMGNHYKIKDALKNGMHPDVRTVKNIKDGMTPLLTAVSYRRMLVTEILLDEGADPNLTTQKLGISNITPLMIASQQGPVEIVKDLVNYGAEINTKTTGIIAGNTALMVAIKNQRDDIVQFLLSENADVNIVTTSGEVANVNALMIAAQTGNLPLVKLLTSIPYIKLDTEDSEGRNALVYAYISGNIELISYLISLGMKTSLSPLELKSLMRETLRP